MKWMDMKPGEMSPSSTQIQFGQKILLRHWALQKQNALKRNAIWKNPWPGEEQLAPGNHGYSWMKRGSMIVKYFAPKHIPTWKRPL